MHRRIFSLCGGMRVCAFGCNDVPVALFSADKEVIPGAHVHAGWLKTLILCSCTCSAIKHVDPYTGSLAPLVHLYSRRSDNACAPRQSTDGAHHVGSNAARNFGPMRSDVVVHARQLQILAAPLPSALMSRRTGWHAQLSHGCPPLEVHATVRAPHCLVRIWVGTWHAAS